MTDDGFLQRWSKLKQSNRRGRAAPVAVAAAAAPEPPGEPDIDTIEELLEPEQSAGLISSVGAEPGEAPDPGPAETSPAELREQAEEAGLTPIEELEADSDYTGFLGQGVPAALTKAALRKLWLSDPVFANLDGLNDYDLDYNVIDKILNLADTGKDLGKLVEKVEGTGEDAAGAAEPETGGRTDEPVRETSDRSELAAQTTETRSRDVTARGEEDDGGKGRETEDV